MTRDEAVRTLRKHEDEIRARSLRQPSDQARSVGTETTVALEKVLADLPEDERGSIEARAKQLIVEEVAFHAG